MVAVSSVALSLASLALGSLWYWDAYVRTKTSWFIAYGERWGVPLGIGQLDEAAAGTHPFVYRIKSRSGRVVEMVRHNGSSGLIGEAETPSGDDDWTKNTARWLYRYREDGTLASVAMFDPSGQALRQHGYEFSDDRRSGIVRFERRLGMAERQMSAGTALGRVKRRIRCEPRGDRPTPPQLQCRWSDRRSPLRVIWRRRHPRQLQRRLWTCIRARLQWSDSQHAKHRRRRRDAGRENWCGGDTPTIRRCGTAVGRRMAVEGRYADGERSGFCDAAHFTRRSRPQDR